MKQGLYSLLKSVYFLDNVADLGFRFVLFKRPFKTCLLTLAFV